MKRGALDHPKTVELNAKLNEPMRATWGLVEGLVHYVTKYAPEGDIGKWSDASIAKGVAWEGDPAVLIAALVETRWLDVDVTGVRLFVHDWPEHADDAVHAQLARAGKLFANGAAPKLTRLQSEERRKCAEKLQAALARREAAHAERMPSAREALDVQVPRPVPSPPVSEVAEPDGSAPHTLFPNSDLSAAKSADKTPRARAKSTIPADLKLTESMRRAIASAGCRNPDAAFEQFVNHHTAKQNRYVDWDTRVWATWVTNHGTYACACKQVGRRAGEPRGLDAVQAVAEDWHREGRFVS